MPRLMYWSNYGHAEYMEILTRVGFAVIETQSTGGDKGEDHPLVLAQRR